MMKIDKAVTSMACVLFLSGCASNSINRERLPHQDGTKMSFVLTSVPEGASVYVRTDEGKDMRLLGKTPMTFPLSIRRVIADEPFGFFMPRVLQADISTNRPLQISSAQEHIRVDLPELELRATGYAAQAVSNSWQVPASSGVLKMRTQRDDSAYTHTVVMQQPLAPRSWLNMTFSSALSETRMYGVTADGGQGSYVGTLPLTMRVGFAPLYNEESQIISWQRWDGEASGTNLFTHNDAGELLMSAFFIREGYEPVRFIRQPVAVAGPEGEHAVQMLVPVLHPAQPQSEFILTVDTLPSGAVLYAVRPDGALGRKIGETPLQLTVGIGQVLQANSAGLYIHADWVIWAPGDLMLSYPSDDGQLEVVFAAAIFKEGFVLERAEYPVLTLHPNASVPKSSDLTIPLMTAEEAAVRERRRTHEAGSQQPQRALKRPQQAGFVWQPPEQQRATSPTSEAGEHNEEASREDKGSGQRSWWRPWRKQ